MRKIKKVTTSQDDGLVGGLKNIPRKLAFMGRSPANVFDMRRKAVAKNKIPYVWSGSLGRIRFRPMYADFLREAPPHGCVCGFH
jgi:hypothetical protein